MEEPQLSRRELKQALVVLFHRQARGSIDDVQESLDAYRMRPERLAMLQRAVRDLILDPSMDFQQKARVYVLEGWETEQEAEEAFREMWRRIAPGKALE